MKSFFFLILIVLLFLGCKQRVYLDTLTKKNYLYYKRDSDKPFTGQAITLSDRSVISSKYSFKNGIPDGKWMTYEGDMMVLQSGTFKPVTEVSTIKLLIPSIRRINICEFLEDTFRVVDIYVICSLSDSATFNSNRQRVLKWLLKEELLLPSDTAFIDRYSSFDGEF